MRFSITLTTLMLTIFASMSTAHADDPATKQQEQSTETATQTKKEKKTKFLAAEFKADGRIDVKNSQKVNTKELTKSGPDISGGGALLVMNFQMAGRKACEYLSNASEIFRQGIDPQDFCDAVETVKVTSKEQTFLDDGTEVDALNYPASQRIELSEDRNIGHQMKDLVQLATHEYISVMGIDDKKYQRSGPITLHMDIPDNTDAIAGECLQVQGVYECDRDLVDYSMISAGAQQSRRITIGTKGNRYSITGLGPWIVYEDSFIADGVRKILRSVKSEYNDSHYEASIQARCMDSGLEVYAIQDDFGSKNHDGNPPFVKMAISEVLKGFTFSKDQSSLIYYSKARQTGLLGTRHNTETYLRARCKKVEAP